MIYEAVNQRILSFVPIRAKRVLDLGCGSGALGREIKRKINCEVTGVTFADEEAIVAQEHLDDVIVCNLNTFEPASLGFFDCIICSHILEHLYFPSELLARLRDSLTVDGLLIVALPNTLFWKQRLEFLRGRFRYTEGGLMDQTHYRFFDWESSLELVTGAGFKFITRIADGYFPLPLIRALSPRWAMWLDCNAAKMLPSLCGVQFIIVAQKS